MNSEQLEMKFGGKYKVTIEDQDSKNTITTTVETVSDDVESVAKSLSTAVREVVMTNGTKEEQQPQDLNHQKPEETDNLQKSARPAKDYCEDRGLDQDTLGKSEK
jgi:hypothetical protein